MENSRSNEPAVTVVIPAYNLERYLPDAIRSVQLQTYRGPTAIVVLDDGSSDATLQVARDLAALDSKLAVYTQPNGGRVAARNRLLELATTELIAWLDADDMAAPTWLEDQIQLLMQGPRSVAVSGQGYAMTADAYPIGPIDAHPLEHAEISERHLSGKSNAFFQSCVVVKRSASMGSGAYRDCYPAAEDYDLWLRMADLGELQNSDKVHLIYRVHGSSANATISVQQRQQGWQSANEARMRRGMSSLPWAEDSIPPPRKDDWNRRIYYVNIALKSGNPWTAARLVWPTLKAYPVSLVVWCMALVSIADSVLLLGNRTRRFQLGQTWTIGRLPHFSTYNAAIFCRRYVGRFLRNRQGPDYSARGGR